MKNSKPDPIRGALAGLAAGLVASFAMSQAQRLWKALGPDQGSEGDPATVKAADKISRAATGRKIIETDKKLAGETVHYTTGAALGLAYGLAAEYRPAVATGYGTAFGAATLILLDEAAVPAAGLGKAAWKAPLPTHLFGLVSHLLFGLVADGTRRILRRG